MAATESAPEQEHSVKTAVEYVVLIRDNISGNISGDNFTWAVARKSINARSAADAVENAAEGIEAPDGATLVAVPARHWKPKRVKTETHTTITIEDAT